MRSLVNKFADLAFNSNGCTPNGKVFNKKASADGMLNKNISNSVMSNKIPNNSALGNNPSNLRTQLFSLNKLSIEQLREKWFELYKTNPNNFKRGYLIKGLAYRMQSLYGMSDTPEEDVELSLNAAKRKLKNNTVHSNNHSNNPSNSPNFNPRDKPTKKTGIVLPPAGSVLTTYRKNREYAVKILEDNKFSYNGKVYKSLSAVASEIAGVRWNGYEFFRLK